MRILIFSAAFGAGHIKAAEALIESLLMKKPDAVIHHLDFGEFVSRKVNTIAQNIYIEMIKHTPKLWGRFYNKVDKMSPDSLIQKFLNSLGRDNLLAYINSFQPDLIITTYHVVGGIIAQLRREKILDIPLATVITDYALHSQWVHPHVDMYFVACQEVKDALIEKEIMEHKIHITGIPVSSKFEKHLDRMTLCRELELDPQRMTFLVMCGAFGVLEKAKHVVQFLANYTNGNNGIQTIVVCGKDYKLYESLEEIAEQSNNPVIVFGYTDRVDELMSVADVIITKAGGVTVTEALTKGLPLIIFRPIPGQEEGNALFIEKKRAGLVVDNEEQLKQVVDLLVSCPEKLKNMRTAAIRSLPRFGADRAAQFMLEYCRMNKLASSTAG